MSAEATAKLQALMQGWVEQLKARDLNEPPAGVSLYELAAWRELTLEERRHFWRSVSASIAMMLTSVIKAPDVSIALLAEQLTFQRALVQQLAKDLTAIAEAFDQVVAGAEPADAIAAVRGAS